MKLYRFDKQNEQNNIWLKRYNDVIRAYENNTLKLVNESSKKTLHHIIPRSVNIMLSNDEHNHIWLPFYEHAMMHYYLWKYDKKYARQLWFIAVYGRKNKLWDFPEGTTEYEQLKQDSSRQ